jgi:hypothetical protein
MEYIVNKYSDDEITSSATFTVRPEAFIRIGQIITNALFPIEIQVERKYIAKDGIETLTAIVYHIHEMK